MLLGVLVALIKIADYATVIPGMALFALGALVFLLAAMQSSFDPREVWDRIEWAEAGARVRRPAETDWRRRHRERAALTAMQQGLQSCEGCGLLSRPAPGARGRALPALRRGAGVPQARQPPAHLGVT